MSTNGERALAAVGCDAIVASSPATVAWLTGFAPEVVWGPSPFAAPPLACVTAEGDVTCVCSADEAPGVPAGIAVAAYEGFTVGPLDPSSAQLAALRGLGLRGAIAIETASLPAALAALLGERQIEAGAALAGLRAVKSAAEVERIRAAIRLCDVGQAAVRAAARPGRTEQAIWADTQAAMEAAAGERLPLLCDVVSGPRTAEVGGPPSSRATAAMAAYVPAM